MASRDLVTSLPAIPLPNTGSPFALRLGGTVWNGWVGAILTSACPFFRYASKTSYKVIYKMSTLLISKKHQQVMEKKYALPTDSKCRK